MKCAFAVFFWLALCASLSAQEPSTLPIDTSPEVSAPTSQKLGDIAARLSALSTQLLNEVDASQIDLDELKSSLEESRNALLSCQSSLDVAIKKDKRRVLELWLWRGAAVAGAAVAAALAWRR